MTLRSAAAFALIGMALWVIILAVDFLSSVLALSRGAVAAVLTLTSLIHLVAAVSLLVFFAVYHKSQS